MAARKRQSASGGALKYILLMVFAGMLALGIFLVFNRSKGEKQSDEDNLVLTKVQTVTTMNLDMNYPNNEREVASMYGRIMQVLYNESYEESDLETMAGELQLLYDSELILNQPSYVLQLKQEVAQKKADGFTIQNYVVPDKNDVTYFTQDGRECAGMEVLYSVRNSSRMEATYYVFILRKEETSGRWKILGWEPKSDQTIRLF